jgi:hypothetical protein
MRRHPHGLLGPNATGKVIAVIAGAALVLGSIEIGRVPGALAWLARLAVATAHAQEPLNFRPVPAESASRFERKETTKRSSIPAPPAAPAPPATPPPPAAPEPPTERKHKWEDADDDMISGKSGSTMRIGSDIHVGPDEVIKGDLSSVGGDIEIEGHVEGDVVAMGGDLTLRSSARVDGDVVCIGGSLNEEPGASVGGRRVTAMGVHDLRELRRERHHDFDGGRAGRIMSSIITMLILLGLTWAFVRFAPSKSQAAVDTLRRETALSFGIGALVWALILPSIVALALVVALLCITIIGIPLALAALLGYVLFLGMLFVWGYAVGAAVIGGQLSKRAQHTAVAGVAPQPEPSLQRSAAMGVLVLGGTAVIAQIMKSLGGVLYGLGAFIHVITIIFACLLTTAGAGAWLRAEFMTGTLGVWWRGRRLGGGGGPGIPVPPSPVPPPASPMASTPTGFGSPPYASPGSPSAYAPPGGSTPSAFGVTHPGAFAPPSHPTYPRPSEPDPPNPPPASVG